MAVLEPVAASSANSSDQLFFLLNATDEYGNASSGGSSVEDEGNSRLESYQNHHVVTIIFLCVVYGMLSLTAFMGNAMVIWIIYTGRRMHTVINMYIGNLAMADVIIAVFCIPFQFQAALLQRWDLPAFMCKLCPFLQHLSINASIFTLVIIALDRYRGIIWPLKGGYSKVRAKAIITAIWLVSIVQAVPNLIVFHVVPFDNGSDESGCMLDSTFMSEGNWDAYTLAMVLLQYVIPLIIISITYGHMALALWGMQTPGQAHDQRDLTILANKKKVTKMLLIVVVMFGICWLPFQTFNLLTSLAKTLDLHLHFPGINYLWMASHVLAMSNSSCNPFIYGIYNKKFRLEFDRKWAALLRRPLPPEHGPGLGVGVIPGQEHHVPLQTQTQGTKALNGHSHGGLHQMSSFQLRRHQNGKELPPIYSSSQQQQHPKSKKQDLKKSSPAFLSA